MKTPDGLGPSFHQYFVQPRKSFLLSLCVALVLCVGPSLAGQPPASALRGAPIRGEPIGGIATPAATPATNSLVANTTGKSVAETINSVSTAKQPHASKNDMFLVAGFDKLASFNIEAGPDSPVVPENRSAATRKILDQVPASVKAFNEKQVAISGFMMPMSLEKEMVTEFLLLRDQMGCCYGMTPGVSEWIDVRTSVKGVKPFMDVLITVYGTLHIDATFEDGYLTGIYKMDCEKIHEP
jgi:hypothetical protein